ncbi:hypothetical protein Tco_0227698 [Tanacetum coccineum]
MGHLFADQKDHMGSSYQNRASKIELFLEVDQNVRLSFANTLSSSWFCTCSNGYSVELDSPGTRQQSLSFDSQSALIDLLFVILVWVSSVLFLEELKKFEDALGLMEDDVTLDL